MSEPMRFNLKHFGQISTMEVAKDGEFVLHSDYARLKAEVEAYKTASDEVAAAFLALPKQHSQVARVCEGIECLKAEVERLTAKLDQAECDYDNCQKRKVSIDNHRFDLFTENKTLKAENERLRKAGDAMAETLEGAGFDSAMDFWNAAKEGKQP